MRGSDPPAGHLVSGRGPGPRACGRSGAPGSAGTLLRIEIVGRGHDVARRGPGADLSTGSGGRVHPGHGGAGPTSPR